MFHKHQLHYFQIIIKVEKYSDILSIYTAEFRELYFKDLMYYLAS